MSKKQEKSGRVAVGEDVLPLHGVSPCLYIPVQWDEEERKEKKKVQEKDQPEENGEESYEALTLEELMAIVKEKEGHA